MLLRTEGRAGRTPGREQDRQTDMHIYRGAHLGLLRARGSQTSAFKIVEELMQALEQSYEDEDVKEKQEANLALRRRGRAGARGRHASRSGTRPAA